MSIFSFYPSFFLYVMYSSKKKRKKMKTSSFFPFVMYKTRKSFVLRPCMTLLLSPSSSSSSLRRCVCIYFFISIAALAFALIVMVCTGMLLSGVVVLFLLFFVFFSIRLTFAMVNALCCLFLSSLLCYNPLYSRTLMSFLLCTFVLCFDACHMYFFAITYKSKSSRHFAYR